MSDKFIATVDPYGTARALKEIDDVRAGKFLALVQRVYRKKPNPKDLRELRKWLADYPNLWRGVFDLAGSIRVNLIGRMVSEEAARIALDKNVASIREELGYSGAPMLEKLLIENIVISWLRLQWMEYQMVTFMGTGEIRMSVVLFWERRLSASQHRYLSACQTLAKVRRLSAKTPALQVNIAAQNGQQVNVAGDVVRNG